jgi:endonuclease YncB( thermonuclease family)
MPASSRAAAPELLAEIDAPEKRQAFGQRTKQSLSNLCYGKLAVITAATQDRYAIRRPGFLQRH